MNANKKNPDRPLRIILWGAWYGSHNIGDQLLLLTITRLIQERFADVVFTVLTDNPVHIRQYLAAESTIKFQALATRRQFLQAMQALRNADLFIMGGGVPFFENPRHVFSMTVLSAALRLFRTPYLTWSVSSQPVRSAWARAVFRWVLNGAGSITYRDPHTRTLFESCQVRKPLVWVPDSAFTMQPAPSERGEAITGTRLPERPLLALTPRTLSGAENVSGTHYTTQSQQSFEGELASFCAALDWAWQQGFQPIFIPMNTHGADDDRIAARMVIQRTRFGRHALLVDQEIRPLDAPAVYRHCQVSYVARVHGAITSMVGGTPVMMYAFQPKHAGIMEQMGLQDYCLFPQDATPQATVAMLSRLIVSRSSVLANWSVQHSRLIDQAKTPLDHIARILHLEPGTQT